MPTEKQAQQVPSVGRIVHYIMPAGGYKGAHRPAIIVNTWGATSLVQSIHLQVFTDGRNDGDEYASGIHWATSVHYADADKREFGTWHWPEYVPAK